MNQNQPAGPNDTTATNSAGSETTLFTDVANVMDTAPYEKNLKAARTWLYVIAGFQTAMGFFEYFTTDDPQVAAMALAIDALIGAAFLILALWSRKNPVPAFTTAFVFYIIVMILFMIADTANIYRGLLVKILVVVALVKANRDARKYAAVKTAIGTAQ